MRCLRWEPIPTYLLKYNDLGGVLTPASDDWSFLPKDFGTIFAVALEASKHLVRRRRRENCGSGTEPCKGTVYQDTYVRHLGNHQLAHTIRFGSCNCSAFSPGVHRQGSDINTLLGGWPTRRGLKVLEPSSNANDSTIRILATLHCLE